MIDAITAAHDSDIQMIDSITVRGHVSVVSGKGGLVRREAFTWPYRTLQFEYPFLKQLTAS
jgi:hypothetical protein